MNAKARTAGTILVVDDQAQDAALVLHVEELHADAVAEGPGQRVDAVDHGHVLLLSLGALGRDVAFVDGH